MVAKIAREIEIGSKSDVEMGGILIGSQPNSATSTLRIDDFEMLPRRAEDGAVFMLDPKESDRFATANWGSKTKGRGSVGFFRTHLRPGPLRPSFADRTLLAGQFKEQVYAILLIEGVEPHLAAIFLGSKGELPESPSVREFRFNEKEFTALPEVPMASTPAGVEGRSQKRGRSYTGIIIFVLLGLVIGLYFFLTGLTDPAASGINLAVTGGPVLEITWNHHAFDLERASAAKLIIADGESRREVAIGPDELRLGMVEYQRSTGTVQVTLILSMPGGAVLSQSAAWHR